MLMLGGKHVAWDRRVVVTALTVKAQLMWCSLKFRQHLDNPFYTFASGNVNVLSKSQDSQPSSRFCSAISDEQNKAVWGQ